MFPTVISEINQSGRYWLLGLNIYMYMYLKDTGVSGEPRPGGSGFPKPVTGAHRRTSRSKEKTHWRLDCFHINATDFAVAERKLRWGKRSLQVPGARLRTWVEDARVSSCEFLYPWAPSQVWQTKTFFFAKDKSLITMCSFYILLTLSF